MSRYIDADTLKIPSEEMIAKMIINSAPSIDIVRCKECKHWCNHKDADYDQNDFMYYCAVHKVSFSGKDFCSYGEREGE